MVVLWAWVTSETVRGSPHGAAVPAEHLLHSTLCARHWGPRVSERDLNPPPQGT